MGTSSSFNGLTGGGWTGAKATFTRYAHTQGDREQLSRAVASYIGAHGGATAAARTAATGQQALRDLALFLSGIKVQGVSRTMEDAGLGHLIGADTETVLAGLVDALGGPGRTREEAVARAAMAEVLEQLIELAVEAGQGLESLEDLSQEQVCAVMQLFLVEFIYQRLLEEIGERIEAGAMTPTVAYRLEEQVHDFIREMVRFELSEIDVLRFGWDNTEGIALRERVFADAYKLLED